MRSWTDHASTKMTENEAPHHRSFSLGKMLLLRRRFGVGLLRRDSAHSHDDHNFPHLVLWFFRLRLGGIIVYFFHKPTPLMLGAM